MMIKATAFICWRKLTNVLFFILVTLFSLSLYTQRMYKVDPTQANNTRMQKEDLTMKNAMMQGSLPNVKWNGGLQNANEDEPVDMVYTWVNGSDPVFIESFEKFINKTHKEKKDILSLNRYTDWGTLKFSLRSVELNAPWIRHIYLVTNGQVPNWLALNNRRISVVTHEEIFSNMSDLPAFTSPAIECHIHKIKGLSKRFIYMNDDIIITSQLQFADFYTEQEGFKLRFFHERLNHCNKLCPANNVNNGVCEENCTTASCEFDGDDCNSIGIPDYQGPDKEFMFDSWLGSLMHTHFLLNKAFGPEDRYIPEHTAHLFDKDILAQLIETFSNEWRKTSATKIRHHLTVQPEFAFYNYLQRLEQFSATGVKTTSIWAQKNAEKIDFMLDNRNQIERKIQFQWCKREIVLKRPKFLVFSDHFEEALTGPATQRVQSMLTHFLNNMLPKPSQYEIK